LLLDGERVRVLLLRRPVRGLLRLLVVRLPVRELLRLLTRRLLLRVFFFLVIEFFVTCCKFKRA